MHPHPHTNTYTHIRRCLHEHQGMGATFNYWEDVWTLDNCLTRDIPAITFRIGGKEFVIEVRSVSQSVSQSLVACVLALRMKQGGQCRIGPLVVVRISVPHGADR